jgi:uncharacterized protein (TIGR02594 family)
MTEPKYLSYARSFIGQREIGATNKAPFIFSMAQKLNVLWLYGQPWCGMFVADCLTQFNYKIPKHFYRAKAWLDYGVEIKEPCLGCIVIFGRQGGGHVGFVVGINHAGHLLVLGGNQKNMVRIDPFDKARVLGYRLPTGYWLPRLPLPTMSMSGDLSENEA